MLAADIFYLVVFYQARLYSDALLQVFFIAFTLYGWWHWWRGVRAEGEVRVVRSVSRGWTRPARRRLRAFALGGLMVRIGAALPHLDAALTSYSLVASWWQARKHTANWWLWIALTAFTSASTPTRSLWLTAVLSAGLVAARGPRPARLARAEGFA